MFTSKEVDRQQYCLLEDGIRYWWQCKTRGRKQQWSVVPKTFTIFRVLFHLVFWFCFCLLCMLFCMLICVGFLLCIPRPWDVNFKKSYSFFLLQLVSGPNQGLKQIFMDLVLSQPSAGIKNNWNIVKLN